MTRSIVFAVILALTSLHIGMTASPAFAQEKKGIFGFFNRQNDNNAEKGPIHMSPGTEGASKSETRTYGYGKSSKPGARYEDSPVNAEAERSKANMAKWLDADKAQTLAEGAALNERIQAENAYNEQVAKQQQAEKIAQSLKAMSAGAPPAGANSPQVQAIVNQMRAQSLNAQQQGANGMIVPPASSRVQSTGAQTSTGQKRPARSQGLFNRVDDDDE